MFYVYTHSTDLGEVFYVGKGKSGRAWDLRRNKKHRRVSQVEGCVVEIVQHFEDEKEAFAYEKHLIEFFGTYTTDWSNLTLGCNFTTGGDGASGSKRPKSDSFRLLQSQKKKGNKHAVGKRTSQHRFNMRQGQKLLRQKKLAAGWTPSPQTLVRWKKERR